MNRRPRCWPILVVCLVLGGAARAASGPKEVLVLYTTRRDARIATIGDRDLPRILGEGLDEGLNYYSEYIDAGRFNDPAYEAAFCDFLRRKYAGQRFDLIVTMLDRATAFVNEHRQQVFGDVPLVFLTNFPVARPPNSTGVLTRLNFSDTLAFAETLHPDLQYVFVISGAGTREQIYSQMAREQLAPFESRLRITHLSGLRTRDLEARVAGLPAHSIIYMALVYRDGAGENFNPLEYTARIAKVANAPMYSWTDSVIGIGGVGGSLNARELEVQAAGRVAKRVLSGEAADRIPIVTPNVNVRQLDWRQVSRWGINESLIPSGTRVWFREPTLWSRYRRYVVAAFVVLFAQAAVAIGLVAQRVRRRHAEALARASGEQLRVSYSRIRDLGGRLLSAQEAERARVARDLHDDVSQQVALLIIDLELLCGASPNLQIDPVKVVRSAAQRVNELTKTVQHLSHRLHPTRLRATGLVAALDDLQREVSRANLSISFAFQNVPSHIPSDVALCLFRIAQEALQNVVKHSQARTVSVQLIGVSHGVLLIVSDDGVGFDPGAAVGQGVGLASMRERIESIGGWLRISSKPGAGTRVEGAAMPSSSQRTWIETPGRRALPAFTAVTNAGAEVPPEDQR